MDGNRGNASLPSATIVFSGGILCKLPRNHLLQNYCKILYPLSPGMRTVADVIAAIKAEFAIPGEMVMTTPESKALLLPRYPAQELTSFDYVRVDVKLGECDMFERREPLEDDTEDYDDY